MFRSKLKRIQSFIGILFFCIISIGYSQNYKFGKVSKEELLDKVYEQDSTANAVVLYESKKVSFDYGLEGFVLNTEVFKRIKIYNKQGFKSANQKIFIHKDEDLKGLTAKTYKLNGDKIEKIKLKKEGVFRKKYSDKVDEVIFTMPAIEEGVVVEYQYSILSPYLSIDQIMLQAKMPINQIDIKVSVPEYFQFKQHITGYLHVELTDETKRVRKKYPVQYKNGNIVKTVFEDIEYDVTNYSIHKKQVPSFVPEPFSGNSKKYLSSIVFELRSLIPPFSVPKYYTTTWDEVVESVFKNESYNKELTRNSYFKTDIQKIVGTEKDTMKVTKIVFDFVKNKMSWNGTKSPLTAGLKTVYKEGVGNSADINLLLISILKFYKIDVAPVLVSSRDKATLLFPTLKGFDYVIACVKNGGKVYYLDATDKNSVFNVLPDRVIEGSGRMMNTNGTSERITFKNDKASRMMSTIEYKLNEDGVISGGFKETKSRYFAHDHRVNFENNDVEQNIKRLKSKYGLLTLTNYKVESIDDLNNPVSESFDYEIEDAVEIVNDEIYFAPLSFLGLKKSHFKSENREYPIDYRYGYTKIYTADVTIPDGYQIISMPANVKLKLPNNLGGVLFKTVQQKNRLRVTVRQNLNKSMILAQDYQAVRQYYDMLVKKMNELVVLKKI